MEKEVHAPGRMGPVASIGKSLLGTENPYQRGSSITSVPSLALRCKASISRFGLKLETGSSRVLFLRVGGVFCCFFN